MKKALLHWGYAKTIFAGAVLSMVGRTSLEGGSCGEVEDIPANMGDIGPRSGSYGSAKIPYCSALLTVPEVDCAVAGVELSERPRKASLED